MTTVSTYTRQLFAAIGAFTISAVLFANTLATSASEVHSLAGIMA